MFKFASALDVPPDFVASQPDVPGMAVVVFNAKCPTLDVRPSKFWLIVDWFVKTIVASARGAGATPDAAKTQVAISEHFVTALIMGV
jgi:hypothetical protein